MASLESLQLLRSAPLQDETPDPAALLAALVRQQSAPPLLPHLASVPSLQALCLQTLCDVIVNSQETTQITQRLEMLPAPLMRLLSELVYSEADADSVENVLDVVVTQHTRLFWLQPDLAESTLRRMARLLRHRTPDLREVHFPSGVGYESAAAFLEAFTAQQQAQSTSVRVLAGRPSLDDAGRLLTELPNLKTLCCHTGARFCLSDLRSSSLTELDLETNIAIDLCVLDDALPELETLKVATWYRCSASRRPLLLAPVERGTPCCRRLKHLAVTGYNVGSSLQVELPALAKMTLLRCSVQLRDVFRHQTLRSLRLQNIDGEVGDGCLPAVTELDLHSQWGGRRRIDLTAVNASFPSLEKLTLRGDYYRLQKTARHTSTMWFPHMTHLRLQWLSEPFSPPDLLLSEPLHALRHLTLRRQCHLSTDLLSAYCPSVETLDLHSCAVGDSPRPLPSVRSVIARLCAADDIRTICGLLPGLAELEVHLGYVDHALAAQYRALVQQVQRREIRVTVLDD